MPLALEPAHGVSHLCAGGVRCVRTFRGRAEASQPSVARQLLFRDVDQRADDGECTIEKPDAGNRCLQPPSEHQIHTRRSGCVVGVVAEPQFAATRGDCGREEGLASIPGASEAIQGQRLAWRQFKRNKMVLDVQPLESRLQRGAPVMQPSRWSNNVQGHHAVIVGALASKAKRSSSRARLSLLPETATATRSPSAMRLNSLQARRTTSRREARTCSPSFMKNAAEPCVAIHWPLAPHIAARSTPDSDCRS